MTPRTRDDVGDDAPIDATGHPGTPALYAEMLPLVEAGATVQQAARRFGGDPEEVDEIAEGFLRWRHREARGVPEPAAVDLLGHGDPELLAAERRVAELEAENRALRRRLADVRDLVRRAQGALED